MVELTEVEKVREKEREKDAVKGKHMEEASKEAPSKCFVAEEIQEVDLWINRFTGIISANIDKINNNW